jgi:hypothetical protein
VEHTESRAGFGIQKLRDTPVLDGLREYAGYGTVRSRNHTEKKIKQPVSKLYETVESLKVITRCEIRENKGEGLRIELLTGRGSGKVETVHQLHTGTTRLQYLVENVPPRHDRASRAVPESIYHEGESYRGVISLLSLFYSNEEAHKIRSFRSSSLSYLQE